MPDQKNEAQHDTPQAQPNHQPAQTLAQHQQAQESPGEAVQGSPTLSAATAGGEAVQASPGASSPTAPTVADQDEHVEQPAVEEGAQDPRAVAKASGQGTLDPDLPIKRQIEEGRASKTGPGSTEQGTSSDVVTTGAAGVYGEQSGNKNG